LSQTLDGQNLAALQFNRQSEARKHRLAVHQNGACAALTQLTSVLRAGEIQILTQNFEQGFVNRRVDLIDFAVDTQSNKMLHCFRFSPRRHKDSKRTKKTL